MQPDRTLLHQLWTKAVGTPGYDKQQWRRLEAHLEDFHRRVKELEATLKLSDPADTPIPPCPLDQPIPEGARCQEASIYSLNSYIACSAPAVAIVYHNKDGRGYYMCQPCASHNVRNRGGKLIAKREAVDL